MIITVLEDIAAGKPLNPIIQDDALSNYAPMLKKEEGLINWASDAATIDLKIRALTPWPGCYTLDAQQRRIKILAGYPIADSVPIPAGTLTSDQGDIACIAGVYRVTLLQPENSKAMDFKSALNGKKMAVGDRWGL